MWATNVNLCHQTRTRPKGMAAMTIMEVVISLVVAGVAIVGVVNGYVFTAKRAEWNAYSLAAHSLAMQQLEQARAAKWDQLSTPTVDELVASNFVDQVNILDIPVTGNALAGSLALQFPRPRTNCSVIINQATTNGITFVFATNFISIWNVTTNPVLKGVRVDCVWSFMGRSTHTNTVVTYRGPDQ